MNRQWKLMLASALGLLISTAALNARPPSGGHSGGHAPRPSHPAPMHAPSGNHQQPFASSHHPSPNGSGMHPTMSASHSGTGNHAFGASAAKHPAANHPVNQHVAKPNQSKPSGNGQAA
ncbi:MAG TPA: hypothetical protein VKS79_24690, partial [Gemmataceae bacterium]|nr:hypothetical protein [Gemmataceae bacterium]